MRIQIDGQSYNTMVYSELRDLLTTILERRSAGEFLMLSGLLLASLEYAVPSESERADAAQTLEQWWHTFQTQYTPAQTGYHIGAGTVSEWARAWLGENAAAVMESEAIGR